MLIYFPDGHTFIFLLMHTKSYDQLLSLQSRTHPFLMHTKSYFPYGHAPIFLLMHIKSYDQLLSLQSRTHPFLMHTKSYFPYGHAPIFLLMHIKSLNCEGAVRISLLSGQCSYRLSWSLCSGFCFWIYVYSCKNNQFNYLNVATEVMCQDSTINIKSERCGLTYCTLICMDPARN